MGQMVEEGNGRSGEACESLPQEVAAGLRAAGGREGLKGKAPDAAELKAMAERHQALSDPVRLLILHLLSSSDLCPCVLKELAGLSDSKLSYHLGILEKAGMIEWRQNKNWRVYRLTDLGGRSLF